MWCVDLNLLDLAVPTRSHCHFSIAMHSTVSIRRTGEFKPILVTSQRDACQNVRITLDPAIGHLETRWYYSTCDYGVTQMFLD